MDPKLLTGFDLVASAQAFDDAVLAEVQAHFPDDTVQFSPLGFRVMDEFGNADDPEALAALAWIAERVQTIYGRGAFWRPASE
jgi:hypothetical protein